MSGDLARVLVMVDVEAELVDVEIPSLGQRSLFQTRPAVPRLSL